MRPISSEAFAEFRHAVLADPDLQERLLATEGRREFIARAVEQAQALGFEVDLADVESALQAGRREWNRRWV